MQEMTQHKNDENALASIFVAITLGLYLTNLVSGIGRYIGFTPSIVSMTAKVLILGSIARCALIFFSRINFPMVLTTYIFLFVIVMQEIFFPGNRQFLLGLGDIMESTVITFMVTILPAIYTISVIEDFDILLNRLQNAGMLMSACTLVILLVYGGEAFENYSMGFANAMLMPTLVTVTRASDNKQSMLVRRLSLFFSAVDIFAVCMYGSRGAFVAAVAFVVYYFLWERIRQGKIIAILETVGLLGLAGSYKKLLKLVNNFALSLGYYSRTLASLSSDNVSDSGRSALYLPIQRDILTNPFKIRGINSDYETVGFYCHNWFLEVLHAFGVLIGGFFCVMIIYMICRVLWKGRNDSRSILVICLTFAFFPVCLVSGSIWKSTWFWTWLTIFFLPDSTAL